MGTVGKGKMLLSLFNGRTRTGRKGLLNQASHILKSPYVEEPFWYQAMKGCAYLCGIITSHRRASSWKNNQRQALNYMGFVLRRAPPIRFGGMPGHADSRPPVIVFPEARPSERRLMFVTCYFVAFVRSRALQARSKAGCNSVIWACLPRVQDKLLAQYLRKNPNALAADPIECDLFLSHFRVSLL